MRWHGRKVALMGKLSTHGSASRGGRLGRLRAGRQCPLPERPVGGGAAGPQPRDNLGVVRPSPPGCPGAEAARWDSHSSPATMGRDAGPGWWQAGRCGETLDARKHEGAAPGLSLRSSSVVGSPSVCLTAATAALKSKTLFRSRGRPFGLPGGVSLEVLFSRNVE